MNISKIEREKLMPGAISERGWGLDNYVCESATLRRVRISGRQYAQIGKIPMSPPFHDKYFPNKRPVGYALSNHAS